MTIDQMLLEWKGSLPLSFFLIISAAAFGLWCVLRN